MLKNLKIRTQMIILLFMAASTLSLIFGINLYFGSENNRLLEELNQGYYPALEMSRNLEDILGQIQRNMQYAVSAMDKDILTQTDKQKNTFLRLLDEGYENEITKKTHMDSIRNEFSEYYPLARETVIQMLDGTLSEEVIDNLNRYREKYNKIQIMLKSTTGKYKAEMVSKIDEAENNHKYALYALIIVLILSGLVVGLVSLIFVRLITDPLKKIVGASNRLSTGDIDVELEEAKTNNEIGDLVNSIDTLVNTNKELAKAADAIGQGNYDIPINVRSDKDLLGNAIERMKVNLRRMTEETQLENWFKTGQAQVADKMRGDQTLPELSKNVISYLAAYLDARVGAIYLTFDGEIFKLTGSYAYKSRKNLSNEFKIGEGIVGQAALERESIVVTEVPEDYIRINSGLGDAPPKNLMVFPLVYDQDLIGVVELGSFHEFSEKQLKFIELASKNISIAFKSALARIRVQELLEETQSQAEELQAQQEELRVTNEELQAQQEELKVANEELEEQTEKLKSSEKTLKMQQAELQKSNEELERHTIILNERKNEIENKNKALEKARKEVEEKASELELTSKYKSEFLANMSHELRTPMNSIQILSRLLLENKNGNLNEKQITFAKTINSSGADLLELINEILDLSKIEAGKMTLNLEDISLNIFPNYLKQNFEHQTHDKNLYLKVEMEKDLPEVIFSDRQRVEQIIKNLLSNAIKFTSKGGITIRLSRPSKALLDSTEVNLTADKSVSISVSDTGIGIPEDKKLLIFQAFQQADGTTMRKYGGTGLGLSISRELAHMLQGDIYLESEEGKGSTFTLVLPEKIDEEKLEVEVASAEAKTEVDKNLVYKEESKSEPAVRAAEVRDDRNSIEEGDKTILIIEDDHNFAKTLFTIIREKGFKCLIAHDGEAGLQMANQYLPDGVVLDVNLPRIDGWTVMDRLKGNSRTRHIPVYFISADDKKIKAMKMGAIGFIQKPVSTEDIDTIFNKINEVINKQVKKILIVEDDASMRKSIMELISGDDIEIDALGSGKSAINKMKKEDYDCIVLDLGLSDMKGSELVEKIRKNDINDVPLIIYTGKELSRGEENLLRKYTESIIIKGAKSPERLLDEVNLFLHRVKSPSPKQAGKKEVKVKFEGNGFKDKNVLIVDDDVRNIFALTSVLEERGMNILVAENGREALEMIDKNSKIDLVLMDIMMPEMDGYDATRQIRSKKIHANLPIIALTAKAMKGDRQKCIDAGANDYLSKPVDVEKLISLLHVWLYESN